MRQPGRHSFCPHRRAPPRPAGKTCPSCLILSTVSRSAYVRVSAEVRDGRLRLFPAKTAVRKRAEPNPARRAELPPGQTNSVQHPGKARTLPVASVPKAPAYPVPVWPFKKIGASHPSGAAGFRLPGKPEEIPCSVDPKHGHTTSDRCVVHRFAGHQAEIQQQHKRGARGSIRDHGGDSGVRSLQANHDPAQCPAHGAHHSQRDHEQQSDLQPLHQRLAVTNGIRRDPSDAVVAHR